MRITVLVGNEKMRIPVDEGSKTMAWLQAEVVKRWERSHKGEYLHISSLRTADNTRLDNEDQVLAVCRPDETLVAVMGTGTEKEIHQYYLSKLIGEGTYGRVYSALDLNLQRQVAVKVLRREKANEVNTRRFLREAALNGSLSNNPHVVTVHDFGRTRGGTLFIVMELLRGRPLNELLDERIAAGETFSVLECIHIMSPKPDNIWVNDVSAYAHSARPSDHLTKIMDFGIAVHDEITHETLACGTRMYSSPEQTRRKAKLDGRSDIWSCGVILYQLLSLLVDVPFDPVDLLLQKSSVPPLSLHARTTPLSKHMESIVMRALEVDPNKRFQSAEEMGDALHREEAMLLDGQHKLQEGSAATAAAPAPAPHSAAAAGASTAAAPSTAPIATTHSTATATAPTSSTSSSTPPTRTPDSSRVAAAAADSEPVHPRFQPGRRGMAFLSDESTPTHAPSISSKL